MASERFDSFMKEAVTSPDQANAAFFAQLASAEALGRIADVLEWSKEDYLKDQAKPLPCNEMGGGSAGLDTRDDFAKHYAYSDGHDGPHSYEENCDGCRREFEDFVPFGRPGECD